MLCPKCQREIDDRVTYCPYCGGEPRPVLPVTVSAPSAAAVPTYVSGEHPVVGPIKRIASSGLLLAAAIAFTLSVLFGAISNLTGESGYAMSAILEESMAMENEDLGDLWQDPLPPGEEWTGDETMDMDAVMGVMKGISLCVTLPFGALIAAGLWMVYAAGRRREYPGMKTGGLTLLQVMSLISAIGTGILVLLGAGILLLAQIVLSTEGDFTDPIEAMVIPLLLILLLPGFALGIFQQVKVGLLMGKVRRAVKTGIHARPSGLFVAVMCIISAVSTLLSALSAFLFGGFLALLGTLASTVALGCFGVLCLRYRTLMQQLQLLYPAIPAPAYGASNPAWSAPAYGTASPYQTPMPNSVVPAPIPPAPVPPTFPPVPDSPVEK